MSSSTVGRAPSGTRPVGVESTRLGRGRIEEGKLGGDDETIPVEEVGNGEGYLRLSLNNLLGEYFVTGLRVGESRATRLAGRGSDGEEREGSKAGSNVGPGAERFVPAT